MDMDQNLLIYQLNGKKHAYRFRHDNILFIYSICTFFIANIKFYVPQTICRFKVVCAHQHIFFVEKKKQVEENNEWNKFTNDVA